MIFYFPCRKRLTIDQCLEHPWLARSERNSSKKLRQSLRNLKQFMARRKWQVGAVCVCVCLSVGVVCLCVVVASVFGQTCDALLSLHRLWCCILHIKVSVLKQSFSQ